MEQLCDGQKVSYVGDGDDGLAVGDEGKVIAAGVTGSHVMWATGSQKDQVTLTPNWDLVAQRRSVASMDNDLTTGLVTFAVRDVYDREGPGGLMAALRDDGHLSTMATIGEEAIQFVATKVRNDPSMREVLAHLDDDEGGDLVAKLSGSILRQAAKG